MRATSEQLRRRGPGGSQLPSAGSAGCFEARSGVWTPSWHSLPGWPAAPYLQSVFCTVEDDCSDLLVHEDKDRQQQSRQGSGHTQPPGVSSKRRHQPATPRECRLGGTFHGQGGNASREHLPSTPQPLPCQSTAFHILPPRPWILGEGTVTQTQTDRQMHACLRTHTHTTLL